jgi:hypothetical protein
MSKINLKRDEIGNCRDCGKLPEGEEFKGRYNDHCTHMESQNGWRLRIEHNYNWFDSSDRLKDTVGELLCPDCLKKHDEELSELLEL